MVENIQDAVFLKSSPYKACDAHSIIEPIRKYSRADNYGDVEEGVTPIFDVEIAHAFLFQTLVWEYFIPFQL
jgi:hypothetical protein